jgi:hypothetical protein
MLRLVAQAVADAAHGAQQFDRNGVIQLFPQMPHINVHDVGQPLKTLVPDVLDDHGARKDPARMRGQIFQQRVFLGGQFDLFAGAFDILRKPVNFQIADAQHAGPVDRPAPQQRLDAHQQFGKGKRLGQVIIRARLEIPPDNKLVKRVPNAIGIHDEDPSLVELPAGAYTVLARSEYYGMVRVKVIVKAGEQTTVNLEYKKPPAQLTAAEAGDLVRLPNGTVVGTRAND